MNTEYTYYFERTDDFPFPEVFRGISGPWEALVKAKDVIKRVLLDGDVREMNGTALGKAHFHNQYSIGKGTVVYNDVTIIGPVIIGENCEIMPGAVIRPGTILGNHCVIGHGCEVKNSVVQNYAKIQSMSFVGDSVIGRAARVGSGTIAANRKFDQSNVTLKADGETIDLGTAFFGCVLGDNSRLGANSVTQPGTLIGPYCWIYPLTSVRGFIPRAKRVYQEKPIVLRDNDVVDLQP